MNLLFEIYGLSYPIILVSDFQQRVRRDPKPEAEMLVTAAMTVLCTAGVAFYTRFLVALFKECKPRLTGYWVRLRLKSSEDAITELQPRKKPMSRIA